MDKDVQAEYIIEFMSFTEFPVHKLQFKIGTAVILILSLRIKGDFVESLKHALSYL